jgi:hypothetical protein
MRFLRKNYIYDTVWVLPLLIVGLLFSAMFILVVCAAGLAIEAAGAGVLELQMRSERRKGMLVTARTDNELICSVRRTRGDGCLCRSTQDELLPRPRFRREAGLTAHLARPRGPAH